MSSFNRSINVRMTRGHEDSPSAKFRHVEKRTDPNSNINSNMNFFGVDLHEMNSAFS